MTPELFGHKTVAFIDLWSIVHFLSGIVIASFLFNEIKRFLPSNTKNPIPVTLFNKDFHIGVDTTIVVLSAFSWELFELALEQGLLGASVAAWFDGTEFWGNRFIADPLLVYLGYALGRHFFFREANSTSLILKWTSRGCIAAWLALHTVVPHSMYIQKLLIH